MTRECNSRYLPFQEHVGYHAIGTFDGGGIFCMPAKSFSCETLRVLFIPGGSFRVWLVPFRKSAFKTRNRKARVTNEMMPAAHRFTQISFRSPCSSPNQDRIITRGQS